MPKQPEFWSVEDRLRDLSAEGDPLEKLLEIVDFELFRPVPDANTLWDFRKALIANSALELLSDRLDRAIKDVGYLPMSGQIVHASLVAAPRQRNTKDEKDAIKGGKSADEIWPNQPAKAAQKDTDARWLMKISQGKRQ